MTPTQRRLRDHLQRPGAWAETTGHGLVEIRLPSWRGDGSWVRLMTTTVETIAAVTETLPCEIEILSTSPLRARWRAHAPPAPGLHGSA